MFVGILENKIASSSFLSPGLELGRSVIHIGNWHPVSHVADSGLKMCNPKLMVSGARAREECSMGLFWSLISTNEHYLCTYKNI